jgi:hypothetical protein
MKKYKFVWIDDKTQKAEAFRPSIEAGPKKSNLSALVEVLQVTQQILQDLETWSTKWQTAVPDLFIIDHVFNLPLPLALQGSSVAHLLRGKFPSTPMICVTAKTDSPNTLDQEDLVEYIALFPYTKLEEDIDDLYAIARDFRKLRASGKKVREHLVDCLKPPARDREDLLRILPEEFQNQLHGTTQHNMARWIYNILLQRPGFLYDQLNAATLLGLTTEGFAKVEPLFTKASYKGVFEMVSKPRWWVSELRRLLFKMVSDTAPDEPQLAGRTLPGVAKGHYSRCYISKTTEPPPDTVVYVDATPNAGRKVVRQEFSAAHPKDVGVLAGFEAPLVLKKRSK